MFYNNYFSSKKVVKVKGVRFHSFIYCLLGAMSGATVRGMPALGFFIVLHGYEQLDIELINNYRDIIACKFKCLKKRMKYLITFIKLMREEINDQNLNPLEGTNIFSSNCSRDHIRFRLPFVQAEQCSHLLADFSGPIGEKFGC
jgi:hypothetical protein